jgi:5-methylcytosine-specific restriction enzyme subunit McrC
MQRLVLREWDRVLKHELEARQLRDLQVFDEHHAKSSGSTIFDWSHAREIRARNWVGVIQVQGLTVEILPKIELLDDQTTRRNLVYMLSVCGALPIRDRDLAAMGLDRLPLIEALIAKYAQRLLTELQRGPDQAYVRREENSAFVRGKLLLPEHLRLNAFNAERVYVAYDELRVDTGLNRVLKNVSRLLLARTRIPWTQRCLSEAVQHLDEAADVAIELHHVEMVHLTRNNERFRDLLEFCRIVVAGVGLLPRSGKVRTFSLLFPMDVVFEDFIARSLRRCAEQLGVLREQIHAQARGRRRWLLRDADGNGRFRLKPDILIDGPDGRPRTILDTKWKRLTPDGQDARNGVNQSDIYQLYAYAHRFGAVDNILLYPRVPGVSPKCYSLDGQDSVTRIRFETVNLGVDLLRERSTFEAELARIVSRDSSVTTG